MKALLHRFEIGRVIRDGRFSNRLRKTPLFFLSEKKLFCSKASAKRDLACLDEGWVELNSVSKTDGESHVMWIYEILKLVVSRHIKPLPKTSFQTRSLPRFIRSPLFVIVRCRSLDSGMTFLCLSLSPLCRPAARSE